MQRVVVLGRGGAGKSVLARRLGQLTALPVAELDQIFWSSGLRPTRRDRWEETQGRLADKTSWILDGDLGRYDALQPRLATADTVVVLDFGVFLCSWRAIRRSRERSDFRLWVLTWRRCRRPEVLTAIDRWAPSATVHVLRKPHDVDRFLAKVRESR